VLWAGKLDYWLIGPSFNSGTPVQQTTVCRFDGVNLQWEQLSLPPATLARLPTDNQGNRHGGITSGACYAWNNCWFFGDDGIEAHWDGQTLTDASPDGSSPWLQGNFTGAVAGTDSSGNSFGLAVKSSRMSTGNAPAPSQPDGSPPPQLFGSQGGPWEPLSYSTPSNAQPNDPFTTDLTAVSADSQGDAWAAGDPATGPSGAYSGPAPLLRLTETGAPVCEANGANGNPFTFQASGHLGYTWQGLSTFPDGSGLASALYNSGRSWVTSSGGQTYTISNGDPEPALVHALCGQSATVTELRRPDPFYANQSSAPTVPADFNGWATAVAANAPNDAWAATTDGNWVFSDSAGNPHGGFTAPHLYHWTDGQPPAAPSGDDNESRPSLFTLDAPVYQVAAPTVVVTSPVVTTTQTQAPPRKVKLPPAIYGIHTRLRSSHGTYTLYLTFKLRRPVTLGLEGLRGRKVVASTGLKHFKGRSGQLALKLNRKHWPTRLSLETGK
jgi:hypothetical protein